MWSSKSLRSAIAALFLISIIAYFTVSAGSFSEFEAKVPVSFNRGGGKHDTYKEVPDMAKKKPNIAYMGDSNNEVGGEPKMGSLGGVGNHGPDSKEKPNKDNEGSLSGDSGVDTQMAKPFGSSKDLDALEKKPAGLSGLGIVSPGGKSECKKRDYVVMIDAGSTGSRVHIYEFDTCSSPPVLLKEEFKMLNPGLSSFDTDTAAAAASLDPLLSLALETVPEDKQSCTPVAVKATAGLRLLGKTKSDAILKEVRRHLEADYPFAVVDGDGISIMDGSEEGVYAWITTNYLLGNIGSNEKSPTAAVFDLGGGSTQIVFEPEMGESAKMTDGDHVYDFTFEGRKFTLYQFSHLGYGLIQGRNKINSLVIKSALEDGQELTKLTSKAETINAQGSVTIQHPCMPPGVTASDVVVEFAEDVFYVVNFRGPSEAFGAQCRFLAESVLNLDTECTSKPCSFNGVYQPSLTKTFHQNSEMWVFSYFYDRTNPLGFPRSFSVEELKDLTKHVCAGERMWKDVLLGDSVKALQEEPHWCLDLSFITAMLHTGYNIPLHRELRTAKTIANNELGWCLGASLPLLNPKDGGWKCRVKKVSV